MAETAPPTTAAAAANGAGTAGATTTAATSSNTGGTTTDKNQNRGLPYYEKLRRDLRDTLQKKRLMDKSMAQLEEQIYRFEQSYLEETSAGNIIKGFDNYIKGSSGGASAIAPAGLTITGGLASSAAARRKAQVSDQDRVFSRSSASFMRDSPAPSSAQTTPSHAPTPTSATHGPSSAGGPNSNNSNGSKASGSSKNKKKSSSSGGGGGGGSSSSSSATAAAGNLKDKDRDDDVDGAADGSDAKPPAKRLKISYGRD